MNKNIDNKKRAVIYCRVSTKEQAEEGNSLVSQERNCKEYALKNGYEIVEVFVEQGESAKTVNRTELKKLFQYCASKKNNIQAVIAYKIDRISRNTDDYSQIRLYLNRYGVEIKSTTEFFENTPAGRFMENIIANVAQFDNDVRTERSVGGMKEAIREGRYVWKAPFGYANAAIDGKANIVPSDKAIVIKKVFELIADGNVSADEVRRIMTNTGLCNNSGAPMAKSHFYRLLRNEIYAGWICKFGERHKGKFEPIISEELFNRAQRVLLRKKPRAIYKLDNPDFLLRRFIIHPTGEKITGGWSQGRIQKYPYYRFTVARQNWRKDELEKRFYHFLDKFAFTEVLFKKLKEIAIHKFSEVSNEKQVSRDSLVSLEQELKKRQSAIVEKSITGVLNDTLAREQLEKIDDQLWEVQKNLNQTGTRPVQLLRIVNDLRSFLLHPSEVMKKRPTNHP